MAKKEKKSAVTCAASFRVALFAWLAQDGRTKSSLATTAGISRSHLDKILRGDCIPSIDVAEHLSNACGLQLEHMLTVLS